MAGMGGRTRRREALLLGEHANLAEECALRGI
jgi:hypothetical protein